MILSSLSALGTFAVSVPAYIFLFRRNYTWTYRILCLAIVFLGLAKLCRFRTIADPYVEPWLYGLTGIHNLPIAMAASCAIVAYTAVLLAAVSRTSTRVRIIIAVGVITLLFWVSFSIGYGTTASGRIASDGLDNPAQAVAWTLPLLLIVVVSSAVVAVSLREINLRPPKSGIGVPHGLIIAGIGGIFYSLNKVIHVGLSTIEAPNFLIGTVTFIGLIALPLSVLVLAVVVYSPPLSELANRVWRFRRLRSADNSLTTAAAWTMSADPLASHRFMVDVSDEEIMNAQRDIAS